MILFCILVFLNLTKLIYSLHFSKNPPKTEHGGGTFAFGVNNDATLFTPTREQAEDIVDRLGNIARGNLHIPIKLEHASAEYDGQGILFVHVPEQIDKPVYLRGGTIYDSYYRSAGQTHKMSRQQVHDMIAAGLIKAQEDQSASTKFWGYVPYYV